MLGIQAKFEHSLIKTFKNSNQNWSLGLCGMVEQMRCGLATSKTLENRKQKYNVVMAVMEGNKVLYRDNCKEIIIKA